MQSRELEIHVHALSYLVTIVIQRLHESDPAWTGKLLEDIRSDRVGASQYGSQAELAERISAKPCSSSKTPLRPSPLRRPMFHLLPARPMASNLITTASPSLTPDQYRDLADVPPELEWLK